MKNIDNTSFETILDLSSVIGGSFASQIIRKTPGAEGGGRRVKRGTAGEIIRKTPGAEGGQLSPRSSTYDSEPFFHANGGFLGGNI